MVNQVDARLHTFHSKKYRGVVKEAITFLERTPLHELPPSTEFNGNGVYAMYYSGDFKHYRPLVDMIQEGKRWPIYVGKAVPTGWRTARAAATENPVLFRRLREHARSIEQVSDLELVDFKCRFMILNDLEGDLVVPVEAELIRFYRPLWNSVLDGFGNHDPGSGRYDQAKSEWDVLHEGRPWAQRLKGQSPERSGVIAKIKQFFR